MIARYGDRASFLTLFNPDLQKKICKDSDICFFGDAPVLSQLNMAYGEMTAIMWLVPQLYNLSEYCGCKDKLQGDSLEECASVIASEFFYLKVTELMLFFHRFKSGRYGRFYGSVDPLVITTSLRTFLSERSQAIYEQEKFEEKERLLSQSEEEVVDGSEQLTELANSLMGRSTQPTKTAVRSLSNETLLKMAKEIVHGSYKADANTQQSFAKIFKMHSGMTPSEYLSKYGA